MKPLTSRSQIIVKWTTAPSDLGYGGTPTNWEQQPGQRMGLKHALQFPEELTRQIGNCYRKIAYFYHGTSLLYADIQEAVYSMEWKRERKKGTL